VTEAMACGLPVIASDATSHPEQIAHGVHGFLVPLGQWEGVAEAIGELATDAGKRTAMGQAARERVTTEFSWERMIERYDAVLGATVETFHPESPGHTGGTKGL
jgi:glycosyltransferase involved in cell wall biosynthesis